MLLYNQGKPGGPFRLDRYPRSRRMLKRELGARRFAVAPDAVPLSHDR
jgi:hypothetical protein